MNKCIYKQKSDLTYKSAEHIIPAGLGGIKKLPKGYVSDEANNLFSKMEMKALRSSLLTGSRLRHGPGKRGNQKVEKEKMSEIKLLHKENTNDSMLGYIFMGSAYIIPQISCEFTCLSKVTKIDFIGDDYDNDDFSGYFSSFKRKLFEFLLNSKRDFTFIKNDEKSNCPFYIGLHKKKWYISSNSQSFKLDNYINIIINYFIMNLKNPSRIINNNINYNEDKLQIRYNFKINMTDMSFYWLFLKIAFNFLAYSLGQEIVLSNAFDKVRESIVNCENIISYFRDSSNGRELFEEYKRNLKNNEHYIFIISKGATIYSYVSLYNEWYATMILSSDYQGERIVAAFICDWKSKNEYEYSENSNNKKNIWI